jgi:hypothetical protein
MNKNWIVLLIVAVFTLISYVGYTFYVSITGENTGFGKVVNPINRDLGSQVLDKIALLDENAPVRDEALDNK